MDKEWISLKTAVSIQKNDVIRDALNPKSDAYVDYEVVTVDDLDIVLKNREGIRRVPILDLPMMHLYYLSP